MKKNKKTTKYIIFVLFVLILILAGLIGLICWKVNRVITSFQDSAQKANSQNTPFSD